MASVKAEKIWADALRKAVHGYMEVKSGENGSKKVRVLNRLAETLCKAAAKGDIQAIKEVGDRLDGKASQSVAVVAEVKITKITEEFVMPDGERYRTEDTDTPDIPTSH